MNFINGLGEKAIQDVMQTYPEIGGILARHDIGCTTCKVGICLLKDVVSIHGLSQEEEAGIEREINEHLRQKEEPMKTDITRTLVDEHRLILRIIALLEKYAPLTATGSYRDWQFYLDGIDFIRQYADRFHHAKEEDVLFAALIKNGMPRENSPVAAMLMEHDQGRTYVLNLETAVQEALDGLPERENAIAENALAYAALLRGHISREDDILYPLADRVIPEVLREEIVRGYQRAEAHAGTGFSERYLNLIRAYEQA